MDSRRFALAGYWLAAALVAGATGCASIPEGRSAITHVTVHGARQLDDDDVADKLATMPSPKFLGLFRGVVYDYELFSRAALQRDLARVERYYRARGYYDAHAIAGLVTRPDPQHVRVDIYVEEGAPVVNQASKLEGIEQLPKEVAEAVASAAKAALPLDKPFDEDEFEQAENDVKRALTDRGYAYAKVKRDALIDLVRHMATPVFTVTPDGPAKFGKVTIVGRTADSKAVSIEIPEAPMRRAIDIEEGEPYSTKAIEDATRALLDLEVFSSVEIEPQLEDPPPASHVVPLTVRVEPNRLRQLRLGAGAEFDQLRTDLHGVAAWEDHNFLGGLRTFSVELKPGVVLFPTRLDHFVAPTRLLPEERLRLQLKQPGFLEARTNLYVRPEFNIFPLLVRSDESAESVLGYREVKGATWLDRSYGKLYSSVGYNLQVENPFTYKGPLDPDLSTLVISYPEVNARLDFRDDRVHPHKGIYLATNLQVAGGPFGGRARDVKVQPEVRTYLPLASKITFATRASVGFLFPRNYGDVVENHLAEPTLPANRAERVRDIETVFFRGFYSGGPSSNRGYPTRAIAPYGVVPFLNPTTVSQQVATSCDPSDADTFDAKRCAIPIGGFTLWEFSNEVRFQVTGPLSAAVFVDMSDVSPKPSDIRLTYLHLSTGVGARYETPVGPIRLDIGYRVQPLQVLGFRNEDDVAQQDLLAGLPPKMFGIPLAIAFGIGEAY
jgi:outer membrane protein insertion porin family/translocation and assembly module TamA